MSDAISTNPYAVPTSELQEAPSGDQTPSIEQALSRGYDFSIGSLISEAWQLTKGTKGIIIGGFLVFYVAMFIASFVIGAVLGVFTLFSENLVLIIISQVVTTILASAAAYPFMAGLNMVGIRRAAGQPFSFNEIFSHFGRTVPLLITAVVMMLLIYIGIFLLVLPGIYLAVAYMLAIPLVVERGLSPWQALETSRKAISQHWFKAFGLFLLLGLIVAISAIPLGIGLIWSVPLFVVAMGVLYRTIFGVLPVAR
ncbi:hypothetical protein DNK06_09285 [Pseudomonas daroniae]|uniref:DUF975 domain-containing protein n=1 Tax=Phytopseudomonas daroniae TaxID=2487519 RepID=A0A4Q9QME6_9GAMM|nr:MULTISPECIES: hypothetical protein [Pseudomonas]TBU80679.1 hypothetical protein DNK06_09285 [Pseudomonas daroniae]TBU81714.1 hypothetical protein DNK31_13305 [Pseudomonas sp. FRB 228]TBU90704.1 hypothetical protein DNJ99_12195 [Pseudomonas daroniae]